MISAALNLIAVVAILTGTFALAQSVSVKNVDIRKGAARS
jgi:hypothetical protein